MIVEQPSDDELRLLIKNFRSVRRLDLTTNKRESLKQEKPPQAMGLFLFQGHPPSGRHGGGVLVTVGEWLLSPMAVLTLFFAVMFTD